MQMQVEVPGPAVDQPASAITAACGILRMWHNGNIGYTSQPEILLFTI